MPQCYDLEDTILVKIEIDILPPLNMIAKGYQHTSIFDHGDIITEAW